VWFLKGWNTFCGKEVEDFQKIFRICAIGPGHQNRIERIKEKGIETSTNTIQLLLSSRDDSKFAPKARQVV